jgi:small subunit ribosomal protein S18
MQSLLSDSNSDTRIEFDLLSYKDANFLAKYVSAQGKIFPRRITKLSSKQQKTLARLVKTARIAALLPFLCNSRRFKR